jgi:hypothetical protein
MSIVASELILYGATSRPEDDTSTVGGAIILTARPFDADTVSAQNLEVLSSSASDTTQTLTLRYRDAGGVIQTATAVTLTGVTPAAINPAITAERLIEATLSATCVGTITLRIASAGATQHSFAPGELKAFRMFINAVSGASQKVYYEKLFFKNTNGSLTLQSAIVKMTADPSGKLRIRLEDAQSDNNSAANRLTDPTGNGGSWTEENVDISVPGTNMVTAAYIGVWVELTLAASNAAIKSSGTYELRGQST